MGFSSTHSAEPLRPSFASNMHTLRPSASFDLEFDDYEVNFESLLYKMIWDFGLGCLIPRRQRQSSSAASGGVNEEKDGGCGGNLEHNKAWLLAESGGCGAEEPELHTVHSSFRFSFCSQVELESMTVNNNCSATILMVNLDNGLLTDPKSRESKWRRIESLERSISPVARTLIRFTYSEILSATRNFSKGNQNANPSLSCNHFD